MSFDAVHVMKAMDPVSWGIVYEDWLTQQVEDECFFEVDGLYYHSEDVARLC